MSGLLKLLLAISILAHTTIVHAESENEKGVESLSPELRGLLSKEMVAIQDGMMSVMSAYASGNTGEIASIAEKIKNSYILKQAMTPQQMHELHQKLPKSFVQLDHQFHHDAGLLAKAARENDDELISFYFSKLVDSCSGCHSQHARHRFPTFDKPNDSRLTDRQQVIAVQQEWIDAEVSHDEAVLNRALALQMNGIDSEVASEASMNIDELTDFGEP